MATILIPTPLRKFTENNSKINIEGATIKIAFESLVGQYEGLAKHLLDDKGNIRSFIRVYLGDEDINALNRDETEVKEDSVISIVPAIAGGAA
ncbi:MAG: MoaD/ThiS family protein [Saprospiraceae bacterium]|nr:MoaD/ThiS family protein [Saprospiraceae bacterium]